VVALKLSPKKQVTSSDRFSSLSVIVGLRSHRKNAGTCAHIKLGDLVTVVTTNECRVHIMGARIFWMKHQVDD